MTIYPERQTGHLIYVSFKGCFFPNVSKYSLVTVYYITLKPDLLKNLYSLFPFKTPFRVQRNTTEYRLSPYNILYFATRKQTTNFC